MFSHNAHSVRPRSRCSSASGGASVLASSFARFAPDRPDRRRLRPQHRVLDDPVPRLYRRAWRRRSRSPIRSGGPPGAIYDTVLAAIVGPLAVAIARPAHRAGAGRLVSTVPSTGAPAPARQLSRFLVVRRSSSCIGVGALTARLVLPAGRQRRRSTRPSRPQNRTVARADPVAARPDLRPQRPAARHERADVRGQGPPGRPARSIQRDAVVTRWPRCSRWTRPTSTPTIDATRAPASTSSGSPRT